MKKELAGALDALSTNELAPVENTEESKEEVQASTEESKEEVQASTEETDVHSNIEDKIKEEVVSEEATTEAPKFTEESFYNYASEMLGKEVKSKEDFFVDREVEKVVEKDREYLSDFAKNYETYYKETNRTPQDFLNLNRDISAMSKEQVVKESLARNNPSLSASDVDFLYKDTYNTDEYELSETETKRKEIKFKTDYDRSVREMESEKKKFLVPQENSLASIEAKGIEQADQRKKEAQMWTETVNKTNELFKSLEIDLGDDIKYTHNVDASVSSSVKDIASDNTMQKWMAQYSNESGALDTLGIQEDLYFLKNKSKLLSEAFKQGQAFATEGIVKSDKNIDFKSDQQVVPKKVLSKKAEQEEDLFSARFKKY